MPPLVNRYFIAPTGDGFGGMTILASLLLDLITVALGR